MSRSKRRKKNRQTIHNQITSPANPEPDQTPEALSIKKSEDGNSPFAGENEEQKSKEKDKQDIPSILDVISQKVYLPVYDFVSDFLRTFKLEIIVALIGLVLAYGQYIQNIVAIRINVTQIWREGYNDNVRNRVSKYITFHNRWEENCKSDQKCLGEIKQTVETLVKPQRIYFGEIERDRYILELICEDLKELGEKTNKYTSDELDSKSKNTSSPSLQACDLGNADKPTKEEVIQAVLRYRNAIIECLNTAEAVKAVMDAKPYFKRDIVYKDTLPGRYKDIINEHTAELMHFIDEYRKFKDNRETDAWFVLTNPESDENERRLLERIKNVILLVVLIIFLFRLLAWLFRKDKNQIIIHIRKLDELSSNETPTHSRNK